MSGLFVEDFERAQSELREARKQSDVWESKFTDSVTQRRLAEHRAAEAEAGLEKFQKDLDAVRRELSDSRKIAEAAQVAQAEANKQSERATRLLAQLETTKDKLRETEAALKKSKGHVRDLEQTLREREQQFAEASTAVEALRQRVQADLVLAKVKLG